MATMDYSGHKSDLAKRKETMEASDKVLYQPSATSLLKWRRERQQVLAGKKQGRIAIMGDSIAYGAAGTGATVPKPVNCYPGQLKTMLDTHYGSAGSGIVFANHDTRTNPTWDPRFTFGGTSMVNQSFGLHSYTCWRLNGASDATLDFTDIADEFYIYALASNGATFSIQVDAGTIHTAGLQATGSGGTLTKEPGHYATAGNAINVWKVTTGSTASHTVKIRPAVTAAQDLFFLGVEARVTGNGRFSVSNASVSGKSLQTFYGGSTNPGAWASTWGDTTALQGMPIVDSFKSDLLVASLGVNDWQGQYPLARTKAWLEALITRQRGQASVQAGVVQANGEIVLLWNPKPDVATLGGGAYLNPNWDEYRNLFYEVATEQDVALIDLGGLWRDYSTANGYGMYADIIHPGDKGAGDIAGMVYKALFNEA